MQCLKIWGDGSKRVKNEKKQKYENFWKKCYIGAL